MQGNHGNANVAACVVVRWTSEKQRIMTQIISRQEAKASGLARYFTGKLCKRGHVAERLASTGVCVECNKETARTRTREWAKANPLKRSETQRKYRARNLEKARATARNSTRAWGLKNKDKVLANTHRRRASVRLRVPAWFGEFDQFVMREAADLSHCRELATGFKWHIDHMIPMCARKASGLHCAANLQVIPAILNIKKLNRMVMTTPGEWVRHG